MQAVDCDGDCRGLRLLPPHQEHASPRDAPHIVHADVLYAYVFAASAAFTRSGVIGYWRSRTPVASKNALAIAAAVAPMTSSPAPVEGSSRRCTTTAVTSGCSAKRSTG